MFNLKRFFTSRTSEIPVGKAEKEMLEFFVSRKEEFENWSLFHPNQKIRFQFYYPTALEFYFEGFRLFTAYFKRNSLNEVELQELKMSETNSSSIHCTAWTPFAEVIANFLTYLEENNKVALKQQTRPLLEYEALCEGRTPATKGEAFTQKLKPRIVAQ